ncbi:MAG: hypothetical protein ACK5B9_08155 [Flavobacteriia bacterium]|jgi:hypothetical protein
MEANNFDTVFLKDFHQLTESEKLEMKDLFTTEDEFLNLKYVLGSINQSILEQKTNEPSPKIKADLDHLFHQTYQNRGVLWYNAVGTFFISREKNWHQQNLTRIAAIFCIILVTIPFWKAELKSNEPLLSKVEQAQEEQKTQIKDSSLKEKSVLDTSNKPQNSIALDEEPESTIPIYTDRKVVEDFVAVEMKLAESLSMDMEEMKSEPTFSMAAGTAFKDHPDGVFDDKSITKLNNFTVVNHTDILDVLTATY